MIHQGRGKGTSVFGGGLGREFAGKTPEFNAISLR